MSLKIHKIKGKIKVKTGLHIGAGRDTIEIGGNDNPVIKDPITGDPYIPGSSLKGKLRALLEWFEGRVHENQGNPCNCGNCIVCDIFGTSNKEGRKNPTRIIVRDAFIDKDTLEKVKTEGLMLFEEKYENALNRITAEANPRPIERVIPGVCFDFEIAYKIFNENDKEDEILNKILTSMALLEEDYLGGGGSRGNGKVEFIDLKLIKKSGDEDLMEKFKNIKSSL